MRTSARRNGSAASFSDPRAIPGITRAAAHRDNYADVPVFDMLFGTFDNPRDFAPENGFYDGASLRLRDMLLFRDIAEPEAVPATRTS